MKPTKKEVVIIVLLNLAMFMYSFIMLIKSIGVSNLKTGLTMLPAIFFLSTSLILLIKFRHQIFDKGNKI